MLTNVEVQKIAKLAKLRLQDSEVEIFTKQLSSILDLVNKLQELDCNQVQPLTSVCEITQRFREDIVTSGDISDQILSNAPLNTKKIVQDVSCFVVPKVVE
jgi:aspartyl-tRNA(Asn)/glutamyl-tRNA(Gln) amidotransferase subunit C